jgi:hypothetical protein
MSVEGTMKEVLVKVITGSGCDRVLVIENLPKRFIFEKVQKMAPLFVQNSAGMKIATEASIPVFGEYEEALKEGITLSQTGDGGYVFNLNENKSVELFKELDNYVKRNLPRDHERVEAVPYATDPSSALSGPIPYSAIPRAKLPVLIDPKNFRPEDGPASPPEAKATAQSSVPGHILTAEEHAEYMDMKEKKRQAQERMEKARSAKVKTA